MPCPHYDITIVKHGKASAVAKSAYQSGKRCRPAEPAARHWFCFPYHHPIYYTEIVKGCKAKRCFILMKYVNLFSTARDLLTFAYFCSKM